MSLNNYKIYGNTSLAAIVTMCVRGIGIGVPPLAVIGQELAREDLISINVLGGDLPDLSFTICYMHSAAAYLLEAMAALALRLCSSEERRVGKECGSTCR